MREQVDTELPDKWKQPEVVQLLEWCWPLVTPLIFVKYIILSGEGVVKMVDGSDIP